jgi:hypothetical protein
MTGRRVAALLLLGLLAFVIVWIARHTYWEETSVPLPPKGEAATNPTYAAQKFTEALGGRAVKDQMFTSPGAGEVLVLTDWNWNLSAVRRQQLEHWVESGGRLVVDRSVVSGSDDFERWSGIGHQQKKRRSAIERLSGDRSDDADVDAARAKAEEVDEEATDEEDEESADEEGTPEESDEPEEMPQLGGLLPRRCNTLKEEGSGASYSTYSVCNLDRSRSLTSARRAEWDLRDDSGVHVLRVKRGSGSITAINGWPFRFRDFFLGDHAMLFVATTQFHRGDVIHFLSEQESASLLKLTWQYGAPVVALGLVLIALALWRGSVRFGPLAAPEQSARRSLAEQIRGTGHFAVRFGGGQALHAAAVRALGEAARRRIRGYENLSSEDRSAAIARLSGLETDKLSSAINYTGARRSHDLRSVVALLESARRRLLVESTNTKQGSRHGN